MAATAAVALPAGAVQTKTFGLAASGSRPTILHPAGRVVHDSVVVYNRTASGLTIDLDVVEETRGADGNYTPGPSGAGLAADIDLTTRQVHLGPHARRTVPFTVDGSAGAGHDEYAAITAVATGSSGGSGVGVTERLAVLVGLTAAPAGGGSSSSGGDTGRIVAIVVAALLLAGAAAGLLARRRGGLSFRHATRP